MPPFAVHSEDWSRSAVQTIGGAFARRESIATVAAPDSAAAEALCHELADVVDPKTLVSCLKGAFDDETELLFRLAVALGLVDGTRRDARIVGLQKLRAALEAFLEGLVPLDACCLVIIVEERQGAAPSAAVDAMAYDAEVRGLPLYFAIVAHAADRELTLGQHAAPAGSFWSKRWKAVAGLAAASLLLAGSIAAWRSVTFRAAPAPKAVPVDPARELRQESMLGTTRSSEQPHASAGILNVSDAGSADAVLRRATTMAREPDVKGLLDLRGSIASSPSPDPRVAALLKRVDVLITEARRRQLEIDRRRFAGEGSPGH
jgi:hypothetical protein